MTFHGVMKRLSVFTWGLIAAFAISYIGGCIYYDNENILAVVYALAGLIATDFTCLIDKHDSVIKLVIYVSIVILLVYMLSLFMGVAMAPFLIGYWLTIIYSGWRRIIG